MADTGWAADIPEWLRSEIKAERLIGGLASLVRDDDRQTVGDAETLVYLMTASPRAPLRHEYTEIYFYLTGKVLTSVGQKSVDELPDFIQDKYTRGLTENEERELEHLKHAIYTRRGGEFHHPLIEALKELQRDCGNPDEQRKDKTL